MIYIVGRVLSAVIAIMALLTAPAFAQSITTPPPGSALRAEILNAYRPSVEAQIGAPAEFVIDALNVMGDWAFVEARPQRPGGAPIDWRATKFRNAFEADMMSDLVLGLLHRTGGGWQVVENAIGPTDVAWEDWLKPYNLPRELFRSP
ncbi:MAG: hypothetical protein ABSC37_10185 [Xanthobacteraceae bacterium]|jgi:hypothetical protein